MKRSRRTACGEMPVGECPLGVFHEASLMLHTNKGSRHMKHVACLVLVSAAVVNADADLLIFQNTNPAFAFMQPTSVSPGGDFFDGDQLDITRDAFNQPLLGTYVTHGIAFDFIPGVTSTEGESMEIYGGSPFQLQTDARIIRSSTPTLYREDGTGSVYEVFGPELLGSGDSIDSTRDWARNLPIWDRNDFGLVYTVTEQFVAGIELTLDTGTHYGFVEFERVFPTSPFFPLFRPVRWGYETTPNTPVVIPAPTSLALLAGAGLLTTRRRR